MDRTQQRNRMKIKIILLLTLVAIVSARRKGHWKRKQLAKCQYEHGEWGECNTTTGQVSMTSTLKEGSLDTCQPTHVKTISCETLKRWKAKKEETKTKMAQKMEEKIRWKNHKKTIKEKFGLGCKFEITVSECNPETNMVTKTFTPMSGDNTVCKPESISYSCELHEKLMKWKQKRQGRRSNRRNRRKGRKQHRRNNRHEKNKLKI